MELSGFDGVGAVVGVSDRGRRSTAATGVAVDMPFRIASLTKTVTAAATVRALQDKGFGLDQAVAGILTELEAGVPAGSLAELTAGVPAGSLAEVEAGVSAGVTVGQVLAQCTGFRESVEASVVAGLGDGDDVFLAAAKLVIGGGQEYPPGERWAYYNGNYFLAGALLERLTGDTFEDALGDLISLVGLKSTSFEPAGSYPRARRPSGGLWSTVPDLLSFCEFLLQDKGLLAEISTPRVSTPLSYGLGWAVGPAGMLYVNGRLPGYRAAMLLSPGDEWAAAMLVNDTDALPAIAEYLDELQRPLTGVPMAGMIDAFAA
ncbi:MAG: hypothetical protein QOH84_4466 [Kribbellaceae bacterium]|nr:hypothetical protein [Kribbellaceae bacterium]